MSVATLASRGVGFVQVWVIAAVLGTTYLGNTYQASSSVSNILFELLAAGALSAVLVPTFVDLFRAEDDAEAERLASGVLGLALAVMGVVSIVGIVLATPDRPAALQRRTERTRRARSRSRCPPSSCASSSPRCCSTRSARSPPRCCSPSDGS